MLQNFTVEDVFHNLLTVIGGKIPRAGYDPRYRQIVLEMIRDGTIHAGDLITHVLPLRQVGEAFEIATDPRRAGMKVIVTCQETAFTSTRANPG